MSSKKISFTFPSAQIRNDFIQSEGKQFSCQMLRKHKAYMMSARYNLRQWTSKQSQNLGIYCNQPKCQAQLIYQRKQPQKFKLVNYKSQFEHTHLQQKQTNKIQKSNKNKLIYFSQAYACFFEQEIIQFLQKQNKNYNDIFNIPVLRNKCHNKILMLEKSNKNLQYSKFQVQNLGYASFILKKYIQDNSWKIIEIKPQNLKKRLSPSQTSEFSLSNKMLVNKASFFESQTNQIALFISVIENMDSNNLVLRNYCIVYGFNQKTELFVYSIAFYQAIDYRFYLLELIQNSQFQTICFVVEQHPLLLSTLMKLKMEQNLFAKKITCLINPTVSQKLICHLRCEETLKQQLSQLIFQKQTKQFDQKIKFCRQIFSEDSQNAKVIDKFIQNSQLYCFSKIGPNFIGIIFQTNKNQKQFMQVDNLLALLAYLQDLSQLQMCIVLFTYLKAKNLNDEKIKKLQINCLKENIGKENQVQFNLKLETVSQEARYEIKVINDLVPLNIVQILHQELYHAFELKMEKIQFQNVKIKEFVRVKKQNKVFKITYRQNRPSSKSYITQQKIWSCDCQYYQKVGIPCRHQIRVCLTYYNSIFKEVSSFWKPAKHKSIKRPIKKIFNLQNIKAIQF